MIGSFLLLMLCMFMLAIAYFAWKRNEEAAKVFDRQQQLIAWFRADRQLFIEKYPNTKVLFPSLHKTSGGYRVVEGQGQNNSWWTLDQWFTEQHPYVAHVAHHTSHKMSGEHNGVKTYVNSVYELRRIKPDQKTKGGH